MHVEARLVKAYKGNMMTSFLRKAYSAMPMPDQDAAPAANAAVVPAAPAANAAVVPAAPGHDNNRLVRYANWLTKDRLVQLGVPSNFFHNVKRARQVSPRSVLADYPLRVLVY
jgi:hypothetical protein